MSAEPPEISAGGFYIEHRRVNHMTNMLSKRKTFNMIFIALLILIIEGCGSGGSGTSSYKTSSTATGAAALSWNSVTTYTDNSTFSPAGYKIYYGTAHNTYTTVVDIPVTSLVTQNTPTFTIKNLPRGTYYFAISVYDASRTESALSTEASKVI
jgi:hypothetical protein